MAGERLDQRFRPRERLRRRRDFERVFARRCRVGTEHLVVYAAPNDLEWSRLGISVSRKVGNAVVRNRVRRKLREAYRTHKHEIPAGFDFVCVARPSLRVLKGDWGTWLSALFRRVARKCRRRNDRDRTSNGNAAERA
ncbi:MAG: ribonuclease P protein component [Planctomycetota bacterium]|nr:MAG: ribonuclease P protein component [Planctomycetota bacterium]